MVNKKPLTGLGTIGFSMLLPEPLTALILVDLGVEIIKIDPPGVTDRQGSGPQQSQAINPDLVYPAILAAEIWQWTPFMFLILLAAWSNVDKSQLEAAEIDGASGWRVFRRIVFPAIRPVVFVALTIRGLDLVRLFDIVYALTRGGPGNMTEGPVVEWDAKILKAKNSTPEIDEIVKPTYREGYTLDV